MMHCKPPKSGMTLKLNKFRREARWIPWMAAVAFLIFSPLNARADSVPVPDPATAIVFDDYHTILGRKDDPTMEETAMWRKGLISGQITPEQLMGILYTS